MRTTINRLKSLLSSSATLSYIKKFEIVSPKLLPDISSSLVPYIGIAPVNTTESWVAQRKQAINNVDVYVVTYLQVPEAAIVGDSVKKGLLEAVEDTLSVVRGSFLPSESVNYLSKPIEVTGVDWISTGYGDNTYLLVANITLQCVRLFNITL